MTKPKPLILVVLVLILHVEAKTCAQKNCPDCGTHQVPYPLSTGPGCGNQTYKIVCENNARLLFPSANNTYYSITSISPSTRSLVIAPSGFANDGNTCTSQDFNTSGLHVSLAAPFTIAPNNTVLFLNCTDSILRSPLDCSPGNLCHVYANATVNGVKPCGQVKVCCWYNPSGARSSWKAITLRKEGCMAYKSFVNLDPANRNVESWPQPGVALTWS